MKTSQKPDLRYVPSNQPAGPALAKNAPTGLLTTQQAANYLGIAPGTLVVWRSTNRRVLTYIKIGSQVRYRVADLEKFITAHIFNA